MESLMVTIDALLVVKTSTAAGKIPPKFCTLLILLLKSWFELSIANVSSSLFVIFTVTQDEKTSLCMGITSLIDHTKLECFHLSCRNFVIFSLLSILAFQFTNQKSPLLEWHYGVSWKFQMYSQWKQASVERIKENTKINISNLSISCYLGVDWWRLSLCIAKSKLTQMIKRRSSKQPNRNRNLISHSISP